MTESSLTPGQKRRLDKYIERRAERRRLRAHEGRRMTIQVDAAVGNVWDELGAVITKSGGCDSSGYRRHLASFLAERDYSPLVHLGMSWEECEALRAKFVEAYGEPKP